MCGFAAMYDAVNGKILVAGGARQYQYRVNASDPNSKAYHKATNNAFILTLDKVNGPVHVEIAGGGMKHPRIFHNAVILPNGDTFVAGGQIEGHSFTENTAILEPEIYSPSLDSWTPVAKHSTVRVYHSFGLLLPDATVLVGGGGLCGGCVVNHFDAQVYTPQYLLMPNGTDAKRPTITSFSPASVRPGGVLQITTDTEVVNASLMRYGAATHALNNDQRRIALELKPGTSFQYSAQIPLDGGVALPGYWMLFVIDTSGVPSLSKPVHIQVAQ